MQGLVERIRIRPGPYIVALVCLFSVPVLASGVLLQWGGPLAVTAGLAATVLLLAGFLLLVAVAGAAAEDAERLGHNRWFLGLAVLLIPPVGLLAWAFLRDGSRHE